MKKTEVSVMLREKIEDALEKVRPALQADGGDVQFVDVDDEGVVTVKLTGACGGCPMSQMTLKMGIEKALKQSVPEVNRVESV
jgi:Fe-S cluster biogenesis protein NfuA